MNRRAFLKALGASAIFPTVVGLALERRETAIDLLYREMLAHRGVMISLGGISGPNPNCTNKYLTPSMVLGRRISVITSFLPLGVIVVDRVYVHTIYGEEILVNLLHSNGKPKTFHLIPGDTLNLDASWTLVS